MGQYPGVAGGTVPVNSPISPIALSKGDSTYVWGVLNATATQLPINDNNVIGEEVAVGTASLAVVLSAGEPGSPPPMACIEVASVVPPGLTPAAPGTFEIDVQEADTDCDAAYIQPSNTVYAITVVVAATDRARVDLSPTGGKFMRLFLKTMANDVDWVAKITRLA